MVGGRRSVKLVVATGRKLIGRDCTVLYSALSHGYGNNIRGVQRERVPHLR